MKRNIFIILIISVIHFIAFTSSYFVAFGAGTKAFEDPDYHLSFIDRTAGKLNEILWQPAKSLWTPWMSKNLPNFIEWLLLIANSILWAIVLFFIFSIKNLIRKNKSVNNLSSVNSALKLM